MKLLVISDIHSNIDALRAVEAQEKDFDLVLCVGDIVDWGWNAHETIEWFRTHKHVAVCGNHDRYLLELYDKGEREEIGRETSYAMANLNTMTEEDIAFLRALPVETTVELDGYTYFMKHSYKDELDPEIVVDKMCTYRTQPLFDEIWKEKVGTDIPHRRILFGHSHQCWLHQVRCDSMYLNPGSLHYRLGADALETGADYIVITDGIPVMKHVDYPTAHLRARIAASNFPENIKNFALYMGRSRLD